ncbi:MAG TPA: tRNA (adenosine(37)-N6)-threonylcarbamoyltransferase complex ATPase subunit type 1 TsaE [Candidatus Saccharimonadales bacterium]|nr:tRNA (adenosine(37)-N6)-threonylcarbamoyltransferase complex ATPase subunit type 1 TsaE [Candidatus Saccharimonadales bacterium]
MIWQTSSTSSADTESLGELLGRNLSGGEIIELRSDLGGGKTTFVRGLVRGAGSQDRVASPTFTFNKVYKAGKLTIYHFDFYRLDDPGILKEQLAETLDDKRNITLIEWADIVSDVLPNERLSIEFKPTATSPDEREITIYYSEPQAELVARLETAWQESRP